MAPNERLFLGVPIEDKDSILEHGYRANRRIRASKTAHEALLSYERSHSRTPACLSFLPPRRAERIDHGQFGVYIYCSFLPPDSLEDVEAEKDNSKELNHSNVFWAVGQDIIQDILHEGYHPRHRRSIAVALDFIEAQTRYRSKYGSGIPCVLRIRMELARAAGFHVFEHDRGFSLHMPSLADKVDPNLLELVDTPPTTSDASSHTEDEDEDEDEVASEDTEAVGAEETVPENAEFPRMKQGRVMWIESLAGEGSDQSRWVQGRIVRGGTSRTEVQVQVKSGRLSVAEQICLDNPRVTDFHHPDACQLAEVERVQEAQVQALHDSLSPGGNLRTNLQKIFKDPPSVESLKLGMTTLQKCFIVPEEHVPENGKAAFFKRLEAFLKRSPVRGAADLRAAFSQGHDIGDVVRCFAVFECQADPPCSSGDGYFDVVRTDGDPDDPRLGFYHLWDICNGKDVYKKYGSEMYFYMCQGYDLKIGNLHFDMFDLKEYTHCDAPVLRARGVPLYLFYEWYETPGIALGRGRWILGQKVQTCSIDTSLEMSDFFAMTEIAEVEKWPPWPRDNVQLRFNENCKKAIEADFEDLVDWPFIRICHGDYIWAFGSNPSGVEHIETLRGNATGVMPRLGWQGIKIESPKARRFASCVVMAKMCADDAFRNLQDESKPPTKGCLGRGQWGRQNEGCHVQSEAIFIQLYDPMNPEHQLHGEHKYRECPECFRTGDRCSRLAGGTVNWDRCEIPMSSGSRSRNGVDAWMEGRCFHPTEAGLETTVTFEGIQVSVLCYPDVFALEKPVWELGQKAARRNNNRSLFDTAFKLLNDRTLGEEPTSLAHVLLLVSHATKPTPTGLGKKVQWRATTAVNAAASAEIFNVLMGAVTSDVQRQGEHLRQKNAIAEVLKDQFGFSSRPKTGDPHGWITFGLRKPQEWNGREVEECFHGTAMTALAPILLEGLKKPHRQDVAHGQCGSPLKESIYLSPSWHYSAHPVYSPLHVVGRRSQLAFQMVLKCEVLRGEYSKQGNTLGNDKWPHHLRIDPERDSLEDLEYLVDDEGTVRLKEVMFRQFGRDADPNVYGDLPPRLRVDSEKGLEYRWTKMLQEDFKARGLYLSGRQHA